MAAPDKLIHHLSNTGIHVIAEQTWFAARETLAIQLYQQSTVDRPLASWVLLSQGQKDSYRKSAQDVM